MAAVMTQIECNSEGAKSPRSLLKLGSPAVDTESTRCPSPRNGACRVFDISPEEALELLCTNIEKLNADCSYSATTTNPDSYNSTPVGSETPAEEGFMVRSTGQCCGDSGISSGRPSTEAFQMAMLSRKFLSKKVPPITLKDYLERLHRFCPMSTAVFLAASLYITRMVSVEKVLRVTPKNMHRLVLAGLMVATKALEDLSYPHRRVAKVGGVSEQELSKLEISFCFLADFELRVDAQTLMDEVRRHGAQDSTASLLSTNGSS
ncbi:hypothetical protein N7462_009909 [Penicillium macrosclerotiorum]|uniref:uncharacterized protein n=1 Tax=Penicillium macrosclerotiorum TaxID=303699 RepID=UPI002546DC32|nr:uncharacterized protein N7462_009909 [Penicillium macrosclerotiorum]KAJ5668839.1 hypothetical protein N7462_009909 [Penicillium macrosclerotiorum]